MKLKPFVAPPTRSIGLLLSTRVNGGPPLRLLLDSGAQFVVLDRKAAARSGCAGGAAVDLVGAGAGAPDAARIAMADKVEIGDFGMKNVPVVVLDRRLAEGIDGAVPLSLFSGFLIRLDIPAKSLDLLPYSGEPSPEDAVPALADNDLLFVKCSLNDAREEYFLLDTGAACNAISKKLAEEMNNREALSPAVAVQGGTAALQGYMIQTGLRIRLGSHELTTDQVLAVDLSTASRYHRLNVGGLIGFPALRDSVVTVNYRDAKVHIGEK